MYEETKYVNNMRGAMNTHKNYAREFTFRCSHNRTRNLLEQQHVMLSTRFLREKSSNLDCVGRSCTKLGHFRTLGDIQI